MTRTRRAIARTAVAATATGVAALTLAGPASAVVPLIDQNIGPCASDTCSPAVFPFTTETHRVQIIATSNSDNCADGVVAVEIDGQPQRNLLAGPDLDPKVIGTITTDLAPGDHNLELTIVGRSHCNGSEPESFTGHVQVFGIAVIGKKPAAPAPDGQQATVISDVDVYDKTNTYNKTKIGTLVAPSTVTLAEPCDYTGDCHVLVPNMQGGNGYAWAPGALQPGP